MPEETFDAATILDICPTADDLWLKAAQTYANIPVVAATQNQFLDYIPNTQDCALCLQNLDGGGNDPMFQAALDHFQRLTPEQLRPKLLDPSLRYDIQKVPLEKRPMPAN